MFKATKMKMNRKSKSFCDTTKFQTKNNFGSTKINYGVNKISLLRRPMPTIFQKWFTSYDGVAMAESSSRKNKIKKKGKFRKKKCRGPVLSEEDLNFLLESTTFSSQEIREWHKYELTLFYHYIALCGVINCRVWDI